MAIETVGVKVDVDDLELTKLGESLKKLQGKDINLKIKVDQSSLPDSKGFVAGLSKGLNTVAKQIDGISSSMKSLSNPLGNLGDKILGTATAVGGGR